MREVTITPTELIANLDGVNRVYGYVTDDGAGVALTLTHRNTDDAAVLVYVPAHCIASEAAVLENVKGDEGNAVDTALSAEVKRMQNVGLDAERVIAAVREALDRSGGMDIVYIHEGDSPASAAIVRAGTPAYEAITRAYPNEPITPHDHIEPGMF